MSDSLVPPTGGGAKYGVIGILLLVLAGVGLYCSMEEEVAPEPVAQTEPDIEEPRPTSQFTTEIELPEEDAGPEDTGVEDTGEEETAMMSTMTRRPRECTGELDASAVRRVVAQQGPQVRACYERALKQNNILQGTVMVRMIIGTDGSVDQVSVGGSLRDNEVFGCVRRLAQGWEFPRPTGNSCAQVNAPFAMTPRP